MVAKTIEEATGRERRDGAVWTCQWTECGGEGSASDFLTEQPGG